MTSLSYTLVVPSCLPEALLLPHHTPACFLAALSWGVGVGGAPTYAWIQRHFAKQRDLQVLAHGLRTPRRWWEYLRLFLKRNVKGGGILSLCQNCMNGPHFKQTLNNKKALLSVNFH